MKGHSQKLFSIRNIVNLLLPILFTVVSVFSSSSFSQGGIPDLRPPSSWTVTGLASL